MAAMPDLPGATQVWLFVGLAIGMAEALDAAVDSWLIDFNEQNHPRARPTSPARSTRWAAWASSPVRCPCCRSASNASDRYCRRWPWSRALRGGPPAAQNDMNGCWRRLAVGHGTVGVGIFGLDLRGLNAPSSCSRPDAVHRGLFLIPGMLDERARASTWTVSAGSKKRRPWLAQPFVLFTRSACPDSATSRASSSACWAPTSTIPGSPLWRPCRSSRPACTA